MTSPRSRLSFLTPNPAFFPPQRGTSQLQALSFSSRKLSHSLVQVDVWARGQAGCRSGSLASCDVSLAGDPVTQPLGTFALWASVSSCMKWGGQAKWSEVPSSFVYPMIFTGEIFNGQIDAVSQWRLPSCMSVQESMLPGVRLPLGRFHAKKRLITSMFA